MTTSSPNLPADKLSNPQRRHLLAGSAAALAAAGMGGIHRSAAAQASTAKPLPPYVAWKNPEAMIVHSTNTVETKRSAFGTSVITPSDQLYIRNNLPAPNESIVANRDAWTVAVEGVNKPRQFSIAELKTIGLETVAMVLQCSGNGRGMFPSKPSGTPWQVGAAGCVIWSGVPVRALIDALGGVAGGNRYMTGTGGETIPAGIDPLTVMVERSMPLEATADALLAWEMNGEPIPLAHGGPLRLIVPGYTGVNNVKYLKRLAFTAAQSEATIQKTGYRMRPPGTKSSPDFPSVWKMDVKSWINSPLPERGTLKAGLVQVQGVAFGGFNAVKGVEVSFDDGKTWHAARFVGPDLGRYAWRQFVIGAELRPGTYTIASRATDAQGNVQPEQRHENASGYNNNSWRDHAVKVTVA